MPNGDKITVPFDQRGFPIFDKYSKFETRIPDEMFKSDRQTHMRQATRDLRTSIERGEIPRSHFNKTQLADISKGKPQISDLTWHHHQESGRMQLIEFSLHDRVKHVGGMSGWGGK